MRRLKALGATLILSALVFGIPLGMAVTIGNPIDGWADLKVGDLTDQVVIDLLAVVVWLAWAQFAISVFVEVGTAARRIQISPRIPLVPAASQHLAHTLVGAALLLGTTTALLSSPVHALASASARPAAVAIGVHSQTSETESALSTRQQANRAQAQTAPEPAVISYVVPSDGRAPDTYWDIAEARLGAGEHWRQIWDLNRGRTQPDGEVMNNPGLLKPGWTVVLPASATSATAHVENVTVQAGQTLSGIAQTHGVSDWHRVWEANEDAAEPGGQHLTDPDLIRPGWTVEIPISAPATKPTGDVPDSLKVPNKHTPGVQLEPKPSVQQTVPPSQPSESQDTRPGRADSPAAHRAARRSDAPMVAFAGGGVLLAGMSLAALMRYRRRQFRWRRPGRTIAATPPELQRVERALLATGAVGTADVTWLDQALRSLVHAQAATDTGHLPDVVAARMTADALELVLAGAQFDAPSPWAVDDTGTRWSIGRNDDLGYDSTKRAHHFAPFPTLASVGYTASGEHWLIDLERVAAMSLGGDRERSLSLARFLAAELAHNSWSEMLHVTLVGFGEEMAQINLDRIVYTDDFGKAIAQLSGDLASTSEALHHAKVDVLDGRLRNVIGDAWAPHILLIAPDAAKEAKGLDQLLGAMRGQRTRSTVALVLIDDPARAEATRWQLSIDEHGILRIPALDVELIAHQIPTEEAGQLARMLALAATTEDRAVPAADGDQPWDEHSDAAGSLRQPAVDSTEVTSEPPSAAARRLPTGTSITDIAAARFAPTSSEIPNSVLPLPPQTYLDETATTEAELEVLAPEVDESTRARVEHTDPDLDRDLAAWHDPACTQPKVRLLGPVTVIAQGPLPQRNPRLLWNTEIVAYLATRPRGVSVETYGTDMWPDDPSIASKTKPRQSISIVRQWLGMNERTGREHLPKGVVAGMPSPYRLEDVLVDAELFRRLRLRGTARGVDGVFDLRAALDLVVGVPFSDRRPEGYGWLAENPLDHVYAGMIVDVAHIVATHHLAAKEPELAASAAQVALRAGSSEDVPLLDLVAACDAQGDRAEADAYIKRILGNHDAEVEEDLPPRTAEVLHRRQWLGRAG